MLQKKGFTLIELMVVILIVSILAAVAIPIMRGRIDAAKWSEGKAMAGTLGTAIRAYYAEKGPESPTGIATPAPTDIVNHLGFLTTDFDGTYFSYANFGITSASIDAATGVVIFKITITAPTGITSPKTVTLDQDGVWTP